MTTREIIRETLLTPGDQVPHVDITTIDGTRVAYPAIWQHRNLVLLVLPPATEPPGVAALAAAEPEFRARASVCLVTRGPVPGVPVPGLLIADRWGEIVHVAPLSIDDPIPPVPELLEWLEYIERRCPECEGEAH